MSDVKQSSQVTPEELYDKTTETPPEGQAVETKAAEPTKEAQSKDTEVKQETKVETPKAEEKQEISLKLERPKDSLLTDSAVQRIAEIAKKQGLTQEQADELLQRESTTVAEYAQAQKVELQNKAVAWVKELETDKEIGGDVYRESVEIARRAVERFATPDLKKILNETGLGNHPELVRTFVKIGKQMADDKFINASTQAASTRSLEDIFYPKT